MANPLLDRVLPAELAERRQVIEFEGKVDDFSRLMSIVDADLASLEAPDRPTHWAENPVSVRLAFSWLDADRQVPSLEGAAETVLSAVCQRCLEPFEMPVDTTFNILFSDEAQDGAELEAPGFESWALDDGGARLLDIVEESLVMALPLAPVHAAPKDCGALAGSLTKAAPETTRPFADLRAQMKKADE
jgi:uncharacterized metal-binding protein YceD (DUF177 family)